MKRPSDYFIVGLGLTASLLVLPAAVQAQDTKFQIGPATFTIGTGIAILNLPDVGSMVTRGRNDAATDFPIDKTFQFSEKFGDNVGWNVNGSIAVPIGVATVSLNGFWAHIKGKDSFACTPSAFSDLCAVMPLVDNPVTNEINGIIVGYNGQLVSNSERKIDNWGTALEAKWDLNPRFMGDRQYFAVGGDIRGIYQDLNATIRSTTPVVPFVAAYNETLNTTYYGVYLAWGGDYSPILFKSLWENWGLQSSFRVHGGVYFADTQYDGRLIDTGPVIGGGGNPSSALSLSRDDAAFIGGITLETRKQIGKRATLSLKSEYEYYSYVPRMIYNTANQFSNPQLANRQRGTVIDVGDAFSARASLRLSIGLGPDELYK